MNKLPRIGTLVVFGVLVGSCAQIIGLGKYDTDEPATAGEGGDGGVGGTGGMGGKAGSPAAGGGNATGGASGAGGNAGSASGGTGGSSGGDAGTGGSEGGTGAMGGDSGAGGDSGTGGSSGGSSGTGGMAGKAGMGGSAGAGGSGGQLGCSETIEITTTGDWEMSSGTNYVSYVYNVSPQLAPCSDCSGPLADYLWIDFYVDGEYTGEQTGTFELGMGDEANFASCSRCVLLGVEYHSDTEVVEAYFFAKSGTAVIDPTSDQMNGSPQLTLSDVTLEEVTIDDSSVSTRVNGGRCLHLANATLAPPVVPVPPEWVCPESYYVDSDCDCGCGAPDPSCASSIIGACDFCPSYGCAADETCREVDLENNAICTGPQPWTCEPVYFGDGVDCDCGCGIVDYDCPTANAVDCAYCFLTGSCAEDATADTCPEVIVADDNSSCL
jgi:hypothetical protein